MKTLKIKNGKKLSEVLNDAADLLNKDGGKHWIKRMYHIQKSDGTHCYCAEGAILHCAGYGNNVVPGYSGVKFNIISATADVLRKALPRTRKGLLNRSREYFKYQTQRLYSWNDSYTSGYKEVVEALRAGARQAAREGN